MGRIAVSNRLPFPRWTAWPPRTTSSPGRVTSRRRRRSCRPCARAPQGLLCTLTDRVDDALLSAVPSLTAVAVYAVGTDNVDLAAARAHGIAVGNTPDVLTDATADLAFALLLAAARRLPEAQRDVRQGRWRTWTPDGWLGLELHGATLGIIGNGRIGQAVARRAAGLRHGGHQRAAAGRRGAARARRRRLAARPAHPQTRGLIDAGALAAMKPGAILVNTARGPIVDQRALAEALRDGRLGAAGLDVTDPEPLPADDPLLDAPNLIVLPHIGSATHATRARMADLAVDNLLAALRRPPDAQRGGAVRVAVVDIGTNSTRLLIADVDADATVIEVDRRSTVTRLGEGVDATGAPGRRGDGPRPRGVLDEYRAAIDAAGATAAAAVLTSAVRDAANGAAFVAEVRDRYGLDARELIAATRRPR